MAAFVGNSLPDVRERNLMAIMRVSAAIPRGRPPGTQGHLSQLLWQIHAKAPRVGQKIGTNTPTPGATWATYSRCCLFLDAKVRVIMVYWSHISTKIHTSLWSPQIRAFLACGCSSHFRQWMAHYLYLIWMIMVWLTSRARRTSSDTRSSRCSPVTTGLVMTL